MRNLFIVATILLVACTSPKQNSQRESPTTKPAFYELRIYYAPNGKLDNLLARFQDHTLSLFEKHGMVNVGYWLPLENEDNRLIYLLGYDSKPAREAAWKVFREDPDWITAKTDSEVDGRLVDSVDNYFLEPTSYSPKPELSNLGPRVFELRIYYTHEGKLDDLHTRFNNHTLKIFEKHGMSNIAYFNYVEGQEETGNTLLYFITHSDTSTARANWQNFGKDPEWQSVYEKSIENGKLVKSIDREFLEPTDFSPIK